VKTEFVFFFFIFSTMAQQHNTLRFDESVMKVSLEATKKRLQSKMEELEAHVKIIQLVQAELEKEDADHAKLVQSLETFSALFFDK
jgi:hypothetical protein